MAGEGTLLLLTTPLGAGALLAVSLRGEESISNPFLFVIEAVSDRDDIAPNDLLFQPVGLTIKRDHLLEGITPRYFHGMVRRVTAGDRKEGAYRYIMEVVPKLWFAGQTADSRIFHNMKAIDIIKELLDENGVEHSASIQGSPEDRLYTVQYNETDLDFMTRLMEEEGYFYFFEFSDNAHKMVITDSNSACTAIDDIDMTVKPGATTSDAISSWREYTSTAIGKVTLMDYDYLAPATPIKGEVSTVLDTAGKAARHITVWPATVRPSAKATTRATLRQEAAEAWSKLYQGLGQNALFAAGAKFTLKEGDWNYGDAGDYILRSVNHEAVDEAQAAGGRGTHYGCSFSAFPAGTKWRQPLTVPRPRMVGIFTAIVLGPENEEIYTDEYGRIKVRFHWDYHLDKQSGKPSTTSDNTFWVRVMQPWSGNQWGWTHIPRIGSEVALSFVDGDPDHPIVVGSLYNGVDKHPWTLPANKTITGIKTRSSLKGKPAHYNEFSFEDKKDNEKILLHAQKDNLIEVENDEFKTIGHDQIGKIENARNWEINKSHDTLLLKEGSRWVTLDKGDHFTVIKKGEMITQVDTGDHTLLVKTGKVITEADTGDYSLLVKTGKIITQADTADITFLAKQGDFQAEASLGNVEVTAPAGEILIKSAKSITLDCSGSTIKIGPSGIEIKGPMVKINGDMMLDLKSGLMAKMDGGAMSKISAGITMIG